MARQHAGCAGAYRGRDGGERLRDRCPPILNVAASEAASDGGGWSSKTVRWTAAGRDERNDAFRQKGKGPRASTTACAARARGVRRLQHPRAPPPAQRVQGVRRIQHL